MIKKEYLQPEIEVVKIHFSKQMLAGSVTDITTTGLDDDNIIIPGSGVPTTGNPWDVAW